MLVRGIVAAALIAGAYTGTINGQESSADERPALVAPPQPPASFRMFEKDEREALNKKGLDDRLLEAYGAIRDGLLLRMGSRESPRVYQMTELHESGLGPARLASLLDCVQWVDCAASGLRDSEAADARVLVSRLTRLYRIGMAISPHDVDGLACVLKTRDANIVLDAWDVGARPALLRKYVCCGGLEFPQDACKVIDYIKAGFSPLEVRLYGGRSPLDLSYMRMQGLLGAAKVFDPMFRAEDVELFLTVGVPPAYANRFRELPRGVSYTTEGIVRCFEGRIAFESILKNAERVSMEEK